MDTIQKTPVTVNPGVTVHTGGTAHVFLEGDVVHLPSEHAAELQNLGHVEGQAAPAA